MCRTIKRRIMELATLHVTCGQRPLLSHTPFLAMVTPRMALVAGLVAAVSWIPNTQAQSLPDWAAPSAAASSAPQVEPPMDESTPPPPEVPIAGGLGLLALAGAVYAARRLLRHDQ